MAEGTRRIVRRAVAAASLVATAGLVATVAIVLPVWAFLLRRPLTQAS